MKINTRPMSIIYEEQKGGTLWLGCLEAASDLNLLEEMGINTVITITGEISIHYPELMNHITYDCPDDSKFPISSLFSSANDKIAEQLQHGSVLVHCLTGLSRSPTIVLAYLMKRMKWNFDKAYSYVLQRRDIDPNPGFKRQLVLYDEELRRSRINQCSSLGSLSFFDDTTSIIITEKSNGNKLKLTLDKNSIQWSPPSNSQYSHRTLGAYSDKKQEPFLNFLSPQGSQVKLKNPNTHIVAQPSSQQKIISAGKKDTKFMNMINRRTPLSLLLRKKQSLIKEEDTPGLYDTPNDTPKGLEIKASKQF